MATTTTDVVVTELPQQSSNGHCNNCTPSNVEKNDSHLINDRNNENHADNKSHPYSKHHDDVNGISNTNGSYQKDNNNNNITASTALSKPQTQQPLSLPNSQEEIVRLLQLIPHPEGGYFRETWRSGVPPMQSRGQTDVVNVVRPDRDLVQTPRCRKNSSRNEDDDGRRNALTSIYWVPTMQSPKLLLAVNESDHVHYYQGGRPFEYFLYQPPTTTTSSSSTTPYWQHVILGPNLYQGHQLQVTVAGGTWKCGRMVQEDDHHHHPHDHMDGDSHQQDADAVNHTHNNNNMPDYTIIGEAVGPGFDFHDFAWITLEQIEEQAAYLTDSQRAFLKREFCHPMNQSQTLNEIDAHYDDTRSK